MYIDKYRTGAVYPGLRNFESCIGASGEDCGSSEIWVAIDLVYGAVAVVDPYGVKKVQGVEALKDVAGEKACWIARIGSRGDCTKGRSMKV